MHTMHMKRRIDYGKLSKWVDEVGGIAEATRLISEKLECSISKAEKMAASRHLAGLLPAEQVLMSKLTRIARDQLFPAVSAAKGKAS